MPRRRTTTTASRTTTVRGLAFGGGMVSCRFCARACAQCGDRTPRASRSPRGADLAAEFHQRLVEGTAVAPRQQLLGHRPQVVLPCGTGRVGAVRQEPGQ